MRAVLLIAFLLIQAKAMSIAMGGDVMTGNTLKGATASISFGKSATDILKSADYAFANLEGAIGGTIGDGKKCKSNNCHAFRQPQDTALMLANAGIDAVALANNHAMDMGQSGKISTMKALDDAKVGHTGHIGQKPLFIERKGKKIGLVAFSANYNVNDFRKRDFFIKTIKDAKKSCDILLVSIHMGAEGKAQAIKVIDQKEIFLGENRGNPYTDSRAAIDAGADMVIGHGPHVPRGIDLYKNKLIVYSLGNFLTARGINISGISGAAPIVVANLAENGDIVDFKVHSFTQNGAGLVKDAKNTAASLMRSLSGEEAKAKWRD